MAWQIRMGYSLSWFQCRVAVLVAETAGSACRQGAKLPTCQDKKTCKLKRNSGNRQHTPGQENLQADKMVSYSGIFQVYEAGPQLVQLLRHTSQTCVFTMARSLAASCAAANKCRDSSVFGHKHIQSCMECLQTMLCSILRHLHLRLLMNSWQVGASLVGSWINTTKGVLDKDSAQETTLQA